MFTRFGEFELHEDHLLLLRRGQPVRLRPKAFDLLVHLVRNRDRVVPRAELIEVVWGRTSVGPGSLAGLVNELRGALGEAADRSSSIRTVHARGYQFVAPLVPERVPHLSAESFWAEPPPRSTGALERNPTGECAEWLRSLRERGASGRVFASGSAPPREWIAEASEAGFEVLRVGPPGDAPDCGGRAARDVVTSLVESHGREVVSRALPLPARVWLEDAAPHRVAGGVVVRSDAPPGGLAAVTRLLRSLSTGSPRMLIFEGLGPAHGVFARQIATLVEELREAPVLCVACVDPAARDCARILSEGGFAPGRFREAGGAAPALETSARASLPESWSNHGREMTVRRAVLEALSRLGVGAGARDSVQIDALLAPLYEWVAGHERVRAMRRVEPRVAGTNAQRERMNRRDD